MSNAPDSFDPTPPDPEEGRGVSGNRHDGADSEAGTPSSHAPADATPPGGQPTEILRPEDLPPVGDPDDPLVGTLIRERWRVLERMGAGSFGTVYKVRDEKGGWIEAMKILRVDRLAGAEAETMRKRFLREAQIVKRLGSASPHIVGLATYEEDIEAGLVYFLMEHVDGRVLSRVLAEDGPFPIDRVIRVGLQVCEALIAAHESPEPVVHRDLKLENLMLTTEHGEEMIKVLDFGIAKLKQREADTRLTPTGTLGTPGYAAPEQIRAEPVDARTDLFALGVILYALLTGRDPWLGHLAYEPTNQTYEIMARTDRGEIHAFEELGIQVPAGIAEVVYRLLRRDPNQRFQSARELREALQHVEVSDEVVAGPLTRSRQRSRGTRSGNPTGPITGNVTSRRLAAVWFADLVGYSRLSSTDEDLALQVLQIFNSTAERVVAAGGGRVVKFIGDAVFVEFPGTQQAVRNALDFRTTFHEAVHDILPEASLRIGIHVGDVTAGTDGDLYGDGVNVASRIQNQAEPGQIVVSQDVWRQLKQRRGYAFTSLGERRLKNIAAPVWLFSVEDNPGSPGTTGPLQGGEPRSRKNPFASMIRAAAAFAVASAVILLVTDFMVHRFALGEWVLPGAAVLLAIGLVVVILTARTQARETWERSMDEPAPWELDVPDLLHSVTRSEVPRLTWARALVGGAMAFAVLFGAAWAYLKVQDVREAPVAPAAASVSSGAPLPGLAILPLRGDDEALGETVSELLALSLDGVGGRRVISSQVVSDHLTRDARGPEGIRALGDAVGAQLVASGTLTRSPDGITVEMGLVDVASGSVLGRARATAASDSLSALVAELAVGVLANEASAPGGAARDGASPRVLSASGQALRDYAEGEGHLRQADWPAAIRAFERAREADSSFAPALAGLFFARSWEVLPLAPTVDDDDARVLSVATGLSERDRLKVEGLAAMARGSGDAVSILQGLSSAYPDDPEGWFLLGEALRRLSGGAAGADEAFATAVELAPSFGPAYLRLVPDAVTRGDTSRARALLATYRSAQPSSPLLEGLDDAMSQAQTVARAATEAPSSGTAGSGTAEGTSSPAATPTPDASARDRTRYATLDADVRRARAGLPAEVGPSLRIRLHRLDSMVTSARSDAAGQRYGDAVATLEAVGPLYDALARDGTLVNDVDAARMTLDTLRPRSRAPDLNQRGRDMETSAERAMSEDRFADALGLLEGAADLYRQGAAVSTAGPEPSVGRGAGSASPPAEATRPAPDAVAAQVLGVLKTAMEAESLARVRGVWTSIGTDEAQGLERLFASVRDLTVRYDVQSAEPSGDRIVVRVHTTYQFFAEQAGRSVTQETDQVFELEQGGTSWTIVASRSGA